MADRTHQARERRTSARDRRRASVAEPFEEMDQAAREQGDDSTSSANSDLRGAAAKVVGSALAAAFLGALGGAAKALLERRGADVPQTSEQQSGAGERDDTPEDAATTESAASDGDGDGEGEGEHPEPPVVAEQGERSEEERSTPEEEREEDSPNVAGIDDDDRPKQQAQQGVSADEGAEIVAQARRQLEGLLGTEAERVSGLQRVDGGWSVMLEVVEVSRVPESTDVLATYEVALDDDRNLVSVNRGRRYRRSQIDEAS
jgi:hypothetical protein